MINNKYTKFVKRNLGLFIMGGGFVTSAALTAILVEVVPDPRIVVKTLNIKDGPSTLVVGKPWSELSCNITTQEVDTNNDPFRAECLADLYDNAKLKLTNNDEPFVNWKVHMDNGANVPKWFSIGNNDDTIKGKPKSGTYGQLIWDWDKAAVDTFWIIVTCDLQKVTAYSNIIQVHFYKN